MQYTKIMEFTRIIFAAVTCLSLFHSIYGNDCAEKKLGELTNCMTQYSTYIADAKKNNPNAEESALMCSEQGKAGIKCIKDIVKGCPALSSNPMVSSMASMLDMDFDAICAMAGLASGPCGAIQQCMEALGEDQNITESLGNVYSTLQVLTGTYICGSTKARLDCFKDVPEQCKTVEDAVRQGYNNDKGLNIAGIKVPKDYDVMKGFIYKTCPMIPEDFQTNKCVGDALKGEDFTGCYENATKEHPKKNDMLSCDNLRASHMCIEKTVGKECGAKYAKAFALTAPKLLDGAPKDCDVEKTSGASFMKTSSAIVLSILTLVFALL